MNSYVLVWEFGDGRIGGAYCPSLGLSYDEGTQAMQHLADRAGAAGVVIGVQLVPYVYDVVRDPIQGLPDA